jgi:hypothetical protein
MKRIYYSAIVGTESNLHMGEVMEAEYSSEWSGDVSAYLESFDEVPAYLEGAEHIPGYVAQNFGGMIPENICIVRDANGTPSEIWWSADAE